MLDYVATHSNSTIPYMARNIFFSSIKMKATFQGITTKAKLRRITSYAYGNNAPNNGTILMLSAIITHVTLSAAEANKQTSFTIVKM